MRFLLDESVEYRLANWLTAHRHDATAIAHDYPHALSDRDVLDIAHREGRILLTNDRDFGDLVFRHGMPHAGVIYFRLGLSTLDVKTTRLEQLLASHHDQLDQFLVVNRQGVKVRRR